MIYRLLVVLIRHTLRIFFRSLEVEGRAEVPTEGPLILAANHPNTLIDVLLIGTCLDRQVGFVAKATLFDNPLSGLILRFFGAVPVERKQDGADAASRERNLRVLEACELAVAQGRGLLIFPEGISQDVPQLQRLKTGAARIALGAQRRTDQPVTVVPVALVYDDYTTFRSRARVCFGAPIDARPFLENTDDPDSFEPASQLTEAVRQQLVTEVVHVDDPDHADLVRDLDTLYGRQVGAEVGGRLAGTAALARALNAFAAQDPERVQALAHDLRAYRHDLEAAGVDDRVVRAHRQTPTSAVEDLAFWLGAPLAWWGILNHALYYQLPRFVAQRLTSDPLYLATLKLLIGLIAYAGCAALQTTAVWYLTQSLSWTITYATTLPLAGLVALLWLEGLTLRRRATAAKRARRQLDQDTLTRLATQRRALIHQLDRARVEYLAQALQAPADPTPSAEGHR